MKIDGWKYYNHAVVPANAPHEAPDLSPIHNGNIWKIESGGGNYLKTQPLLARWTSEWDCGYETNWWYVIKDRPFDISALKSKRRYEINKGSRNFDVREINPKEYAKELYTVTALAYETYPASYRPSITRDGFIDDVMTWSFYKTYGAFYKEDGRLCGYARLLRDNKFIDFQTLKAIPEKEKLGLNAAMVNKLLMDHGEFLNSGGYICDGARSIRHETAFQEYLEKYFGFRKAYCCLHIAYEPKFGKLVRLVYPFRNLVYRMKGVKGMGEAAALLKMEEIHRSFQ